MHITPQKIGTIYFIGIGGIGMSGIAEVLHNLGYSVEGSDSSHNYNTERLKKLGIPIHHAHDAKHVKNMAVVVVSTAIHPSNPELVAAREFGIPVIRRADMLAELMRLKPCIAVSGTHGKTSTTSLAAAVLDQGGFDPTVVNGGIINAYGTNARLGTGEWMVVEADESDGSFMALPPTIGIITNIDPEHLDHYKTFENVKQAFINFFKKIPFYGLGIVCLEHPVVKDLLPQFNDRRRITYGLSNDADIYAKNLRYSSDGVLFDVVCNPSSYHIFKRSSVYWGNSQEPHVFTDLFLPLQGEHNVLNSLSVVATALELGISIEHIKAAFLHFKGVKRRFTQVGHIEGRRIIDDYAHHPVEIETVLKAARKTTQGQVIAILQPHRYSRLKNLFEEFSQCCKFSDLTIIVPPYAAGEQAIDGITHENLAEKMRENKTHSVFTANNQKEVVDLLAKYSRKGDIIIYLGAGDITQWAHAAEELLAGKLGPSRELNAC